MRTVDLQKPYCEAVTACGGGYTEMNKQTAGLFFPGSVTHISFVIPLNYISLPLPYASPLSSLPLFFLPDLMNWFGKFIPVKGRLIFVCLRIPHTCLWVWKVVYLASNAGHKQNTTFFPRSTHYPFTVPVFRFSLLPHLWFSCFWRWSSDLNYGTILNSV